LKRDYPPIGLRLRPFLDGRLAAALDLPVLMGRPAEAVEWFPGLGVADGWFGTADGMPFALVGRRIEQSPHWGFNLSLPLRVREDGGLDVRALLQAVSALPAAVRRNDRPYLDGLPFVGSGWGVTEIGDDLPLFRASVRDDAVAVAEFLNEDRPGGYQVAALAEPASPQWIVAGPRSGGFISSVDVFDSREAAERSAAEQSAETNTSFTVHAGRLAVLP
jgi:hypothetical protein